jgi:hypothetical protein
MAIRVHHSRVPVAIIRKTDDRFGVGGENHGDRPARGRRHGTTKE